MKWTSHDLTLGIRQCIVIYTRGTKTLIRDGDVKIEVPSSAIHDTEQEAFCAHRRAKALKYWYRKLKYERTKGDDSANGSAVRGRPRSRLPGQAPLPAVGRSARERDQRDGVPPTSEGPRPDWV